MFYYICFSHAHSFICYVPLEELIQNNHLEDANQVFLKGAKGGLRATDEIYDLLIEEDCKAGDHSNALEISYEMEAAGRMATTFHFNCLLSVQVTFLILVFSLKIVLCKSSGSVWYHLKNEGSKVFIYDYHYIS